MDRANQDIKTGLIEKISYRMIFRWVLQHPYLVILVFTSFTLFFLLQLPHLSFSTHIENFLIEDCSETDCYRNLKTEFMPDDIIRIVIKCKNIFDPITYLKIQQLSEIASKIDGVDRVISLPHIKKVVDISGKWKAEEFVKLLSPADFIHQNVYSDDYKATSLTLILKESANRTKTIQAIKQQIINPTRQLTIYQVGMPLIAEALMDYTQRDFFKLPPLTIIVMSFLLLILIRNVFCLITTLISLGLSLTWTLGFMALTEIPLSMISMIIPIFITAVGTAYLIYICAEYISISKNTSSAEDALLSTFSNVALPTFLAVITTLAGLVSLVVYRIQYIQEYALFSCVGVLNILLMALVLTPVLLSIFPMPQSKNKKNKLKWGISEKIIDYVIYINTNKSKLMLPLMAILITLSSAGILMIRAESNPISYFKSDSPISRNFRDISKYLSGCLLINVLVDGATQDYFEDPENIGSIADIQAAIENLSGIDKSLSIADYLKLINYVQNSYDLNSYIIPERKQELRMLMNSFQSMLGRDTLHGFINKDYSKANLLFFTTISNSQYFLKIKELILKRIKADFPGNMRWEVTGYGVAVSKSNQLLTSGMTNSFVITLGLIFIVISFLFLSLKVGLIAIAANIVPIVISLGLMGWLGIELSLATCLITSVAFSLAIDDTIHYLTRYNKEFRNHLDSDDAMRETLKHLTRPIMYTTLTISLGFSVLMASSYKPTADFGLLMMITMGAAMLSALFFVPSMVRKIDIISLYDVIQLRLGTDIQERVRLFAGMTRLQLYLILLSGKLKLFDSGTRIFDVGDQGNSLFVVITGELDHIHPIAFGNPQGEVIEKHVSTLKPGDIFGEFSFLSFDRRQAEIVAIKPGEILELTPMMLKRFQSVFPRTAMKFYKNLSEMLSMKVKITTDRLINEALVEDITGLYNLRGISRILQKEICRSKQFGSQIHLATFRILPDTHNPYSDYEVKKYLLISIGKVISRNARKFDIVALIDRLTFLLLMTNITHVEAKAISSEIKKIIETTEYRIGGDRIFVEVDYKLNDLTDNSAITKKFLTELTWDPNKVSRKKYRTHLHS